MSLIRAIPGARDKPASLSTLCNDAGLLDEYSSMVEAVLTLLTAFGAVAVSVHKDSNEPVVKAISPTAARFLSCVAEYLDKDLPLLSHWESPTVLAPPYPDGHALYGAQFLYLLEKQRAELAQEPPELHRVQLAVVIVKARVEWSRIRYLVRYDPATRRHLLPYGLRSGADATIAGTAIRELEAELPAFRFDADRDELRPLDQILVREVPREYGVVTAYEMSFFQLHSDRSRLPIGPSARWATGKALFAKVAERPHLTLLKGLQLLSTKLPEGFDGLPVGVDLSL